ncbi:MAG: hypothetical protein Q9169_002508 [Polycauliona sp. 2 TL-2023]
MSAARAWSVDIENKAAYKAFDGGFMIGEARTQDEELNDRLQLDTAGERLGGNDNEEDEGGGDDD